MKTTFIFRSSSKSSSLSSPPPSIKSISFLPKSSSQQIAYHATQQFPLLVSMVHEQQSSIFETSPNKFQSITVSFLDDAKVALKMSDHIHQFNEQQTRFDDEDDDESTSSTIIKKSLLLFHGTGGITQEGNPNKENFWKFANFITQQEVKKKTTSKKKENGSSTTTKSDRVFLTPSLNLALDFASSSSSLAGKKNSIIKTVFAFQVDFLSKDSLPIESEYGPVSVYGSDDELSFQEDKSRKRKAICYSYVHPDNYQPCFGLLRRDNNKKNKIRGNDYRVKCVGFVDFVEEGKITTKKVNQPKKKLR